MTLKGLGSIKSLLTNFFVLFRNKKFKSLLRSGEFISGDRNANIGLNHIFGFDLRIG